MVEAESQIIRPLQKFRHEIMKTSIYSSEPGSQIWGLNLWAVSGIIAWYIKKQKTNEKFLGSPVVRTPISLPRSQVFSLVREGRSQKPHDVTKKKNKKLMDNPLMGRRWKVFLPSLQMESLNWQLGIWDSSSKKTSYLGINSEHTN